MARNSILMFFLFVFILSSKAAADKATTAAGGQYRLDTREQSWQEAKENCDLSTPDIEFKKNETLIKPNLTISVSLKEGEEAWVGFVKDFIYVELKGCIDEQDVQTNFDPSVEEPYQCAYVCRHSRFFGLTYTKLFPMAYLLYKATHYNITSSARNDSTGCICLNDTSNNLYQQGCNTKCYESDLLCGGDKSFAIYKDVSKDKKLTGSPTKDWKNSTAKCLAYNNLLYSWENCSARNRPICSRIYFTSPLVVHTATTQKAFIHFCGICRRQHHTSKIAPPEPNASEWYRAASNCLNKNNPIQPHTENLKINTEKPNEKMWTANSRFMHVFRLNELHDQMDSTITQYGYAYKCDMRLCLDFARGPETKRKTVCDKEKQSPETPPKSTKTGTKTTKVTYATSTTQSLTAATTATRAATTTAATKTTTTGTNIAATTTKITRAATTKMSIPPRPTITTKSTTAETILVYKLTTIPEMHADRDTSNGQSNSVTMIVLLIVVVFVILPIVAVTTWFIKKRNSNRSGNEEIPQNNEFAGTSEERGVYVQYEEIDMDDLAENRRQANVKTGTEIVDANDFILEKNDPISGTDIKIASMGSVANGEGNASANYFILEKTEDGMELATRSNIDVTASQLHIYDKTGGWSSNEHYDVIGKINKITSNEQQNPYDTTKNVGLRENTYDTTQVANVAVKENADNSEYNKVDKAYGKDSPKDVGQEGGNSGDSGDEVKAPHNMHTDL